MAGDLIQHHLPRRFTTSRAESRSPGSPAGVAPPGTARTPGGPRRAGVRRRGVPRYTDSVATAGRWADRMVPAATPGFRIIPAPMPPRRRTGPGRPAPTVP
eukprot:748529-Hanusia_phi.AAC.1